MPACPGAVREFWLAAREHYCGSQACPCEGTIVAGVDPGGLFEGVGAPKDRRRVLDQAPVGAGGSVTPMGRVYLTCDRCSKTVDLGLDRSNPDPIFMVGYCRSCSEFLLRQELNGGHQRRLDSTVLIRFGSPSQAEAKPGQPKVLVGA